ncbi:DUF268 domain-containing protein [Methylobacterium terricola]|uniref:DUF268 domain-containing protein n=1 Tax=Methylobacterium terricola TaxID=2583531 RepID=A0A5C4L5W7_9HYPH|nr:DUF268 domain-containing protein [Methylobacterium terricola]TNC06816.1 DUF268 domain-containing protein [Methylobacterium terricola]
MDKITFDAHLQELQKQEKQTQKRFKLDLEDQVAILGEDGPMMGFDRQYIYHTAWAARCLSRIKPAFHVDFSSILYFTAIISAFFPVKYYDFRKSLLSLDAVTTGSVDLVSADKIKTGSLSSISCMHVVEHIGLGRYGDPIDYDGDLKAIRELQRIVAPGGDFLFVAPVGANGLIQFNANRIYNYYEIRRELTKGFHLIEEALIPGGWEHGLVYQPSESLIDSQFHACGCFWLKKYTSSTEEMK